MFPTEPYGGPLGSLIDRVGFPVPLLRGFEDQIVVDFEVQEAISFMTSMGVKSLAPLRYRISSGVSQPMVGPSLKSEVVRIVPVDIILRFPRFPRESTGLETSLHFDARSLPCRRESE